MPPEAGTVLLVGAGPGAADLLTVRAARAIASAEALIYDALVDQEILALAPAACLRIQAGKRAGKASLSQETINRLMTRLALRGMRVVRLKGGDPSIFGRSGEEAEYLETRGVQVEIVPGVTAASAAAAQFRFPLTHRGEARRLVLATVRSGGGDMVGEGWASLADPEATVALYMGRDCARAAAVRLMAEGRAAFTPALAIENAGRPEARLLRTRLAELGAEVEKAGFTGPVLLLIGDAVRRSRHGEDPADLPAPVMARA
jgi:uroporphyrin-III C-methyltransferase